MSSSNKRHSILPAIDRTGPKPPVNFSSSLIISDNAILTGTHSITIQSESVVHPRSRFESSQGSILVGRRCIIQERAHIGAPGESEDASNTGGVVLGDYVQVEVGVVVETGGTEVGEGTLIQVGSKVGRGAKVGKHCTISPLTVVAPGEELPDFTTVFSNGTRRTDRRDASDIRKHGIVKQIGVLRHMIPSNPDKFK